MGPVHISITDSKAVETEAADVVPLFLPFFLDWYIDCQVKRLFFSRCMFIPDAVVHRVGGKPKLADWLPG
jgi:hypothetical protein